jgi:filamentous hemagglutinin family protein
MSRKKMLGAAAALLLCSALPARAQVELDGSLHPGDPSKSGPIPLVDGNYDIVDDYGLLRGEGDNLNLYHSFSRFDIYSGRTATFSSDVSPNRVIARVTSPGPYSSEPGSWINGTVRCTIEGADFFLINPWGIDFGDGAELDVQGSFVASTADVLRFDGADPFDAREATLPANLSAAEPSAFGFARARPAPIGIYYSDGLSVPAGKKLSFVAGGLEGSGWSIEAPGAQVQLVAVGGPAEVDADLARLDPASIPPATDYDNFVPGACSSCGTVSISGRAEVDVSSDLAGDHPAGSILIRGGRFVLKNRSELVAKHRQDDAGASGPIDIAVNGGIVIDQDSTVLASSEAEGRGGDVLLAAESVRVGDEAWVEVESTGAGDSGDLRIAATEGVEVTGDAWLVSTAWGEGAGGAIEIGADTIAVRDGAQIASVSEGDGNGGAIVLIGGELEVSDGGSVQSEAQAGGQGGSITIRADHALVSNETNHPDGTLIASNTLATQGGGRGGDITVLAKTLDLVDGGQIFTRTEGSGDAGNLAVLGADFVHLRGVDDGGDDDPRPSGITARAAETATAEASGGSITIESRILEVDDGAQISTATFGAGSASDLTIDADGVTIRGGENGFSLVSAASRRTEDSPDSLGPSGNLTISAQSVALVDGGQVSISTAGTHDAGSIQINADNVSISGIDPGVGNPSGVFAQSNAQGDQEGGAGGDITISARENLSIANGGEVSVSTDSGGDAGVITLDAGERVNLSGGSEIRATSNSTGDAGRIAIHTRHFESRDSSVTSESEDSLGGDIEIHASESVKLVDSTLTTSVFGSRPGVSDGGNIIIGDPPTGLMVMNHSAVQANASGGHGGLISISADAFLMSPDSVIEAKAPPGLEGEVEINAPEVVLAGELATLPKSFLDASALLASDCEARTARAGSFVVQRRAALEAPPDSTVSLVAAGLPAVGAAPELPVCPLEEEAP